MTTSTLTNETERLIQLGYQITTVQENGLTKLIIQEYPLPDGYSTSTSDLLILIPPSYPNGKPDMFWVNTDVLLENGKVPKKAEVIENHAGKDWRRFSWHLSKWNPGRDDLSTYLSFIDEGLRRAREV